MRGTIVKGLMTLAIATLGVAFGADPIDVEVTPVYDLGSVVGELMPVRVDITNRGESTKGTLAVTSLNDFIQYPVNLPAATRKTIYTYARPDFNGLRFTLDTERGRVSRISGGASVPDGGSLLSVAMVGKTPGVMSRLRRDRPQGNSTRVREMYLRVTNAPDRALGYRDLAAVVLGEGVEQLGDAKIEALKRYVLSGGVLVFVGGNAAPGLSDARWKPILPATGFHTVSVASSSKLNELMGVSIDGPLELTIGKPVTGATVQGPADAPIAYERTWGLGRVLVYTFNPFEPPLEGDAPFDTVLAKSLEQTEGAPLATATAMFTTTQAPILSSAKVQNDPFSMRLPSTEMILEVLVGYFLVVVPLNFLILRKAKRGEFAWFTAPVLSLAFAGILFKSAQNLYAARLSTASQGVLIAQQGTPDAMFFGHTQLFVPKGGTYDLKVDGMEWLQLLQIQRGPSIGPGSRPNDAFQLQPVDVGEIRLPHTRVDNLAFRELNYAQRFDTRDWFVIRRAGKDKFEVRNGSPYTIEKAALIHGYYRVELGNLASGETKKVSMSNTKGEFGVYNGADLRVLTGRTGRFALSGDLRGLRPGPQIGKQIDDRSKVTLAFFADGVAG